MSFLHLFAREPRHIRSIRKYLQEARLAALENALAAEHYSASAAMYAERVRRLEGEVAAWEARRKGLGVVPLREAERSPSMERAAELLEHGRMELAATAGSCA